MSKSRGNVITPESYVETLGADVIRAYLMFIGPWNQGGEWSDNGINGITRWLDRVWDLVLLDNQELDQQPIDETAVKQTLRMIHQTIRKVSQDLERFRFNTMLAALMELTNYLYKMWEGRLVDLQHVVRCDQDLAAPHGPLLPLT